MTTYDTIPTSPPPGTSTSLEYISHAKEQIRAGLGTRRPWREMLNFRSVSVATSFRDAMDRVRTNLAYFRMNYAIVVLLILFLSLLWHPISLIVFFIMMAAWLFLYFLRDEPLVIFSGTIDDRVVLIVLSILTLGLLLLTYATINILVAVLIGVVVVVVHATFRKTDELFLDEEEAGTGGLLAGSGAPSS